MTLSKNTSVNPLICGLKYVLQSEIDEDSIQYSTDINGVSFDLNDQAQWKDIYFSKSSLAFQEPCEQTDAGLIYKPQVVCYFPGLTTDQENELSKIINKPALFQIVFSDGNLLIVGNYNEPAKLIPALASSPDATGSTFNIAAVCSQKSHYLVTL